MANKNKKNNFERARGAKHGIFFLVQLSEEEDKKSKEKSNLLSKFVCVCAFLFFHHHHLDVTGENCLPLEEDLDLAALPPRT